MAAAALQAVEFVGLPECQLRAAQAVTYMATAPKSNAATLAIGKAREDVDRAARCRCRSICATAITRGAKQLGHGEGYQYSHNHPGGWVRSGVFAGGRRYYEPVDRGHEAAIRERMEELRKLLAEGGAIDSAESEQVE